MSDFLTDAEEAKTAKAAEVAQAWAEREQVDIDKVLGTPEGRAVIWRLLQHCGIYRPTFTGEPLTSAFNEGRRSVGLWSLELVLTRNENLYTLMRVEAENREKERKLANG